MIQSSLRSQLRKALFASLVIASTASLSASWSLSVTGGFVASSSGDVHRGPSFDGSVLLGLPANSLPVVVGAKSFDDVYGDFSEFGLEATYATEGNFAYTFGINRLSAGAGSLRVGTVAGSLPLNGRFSEYEDLQFYGGVRYNFNPTGKWNPYIGAHLGYKRIDDISATFTVPNTPFNEPYRSALTNAKFYDSTNVLSYGVVAGISYKFSDKFSAAVETGYLAQGSLDDNDSIVGLLGLNALNDEGELSYVPVRLSLKWQF